MLLVWLVLPLPQMDAAARQAIAGDTLVQLARACVVEQLPETGDFSVEQTAKPNRVLVPEGSVSYKLTLPYGVRYNAPTNVYVLVYVNGRLAHKSLVRLRVHQYKEVVVLNHAVTAKKILTSEDMRLERMDVTRLGAGYATDTGRFIGMQAKRVLPAGAVLRTTMVTKPIIVERFAPVQIVAKINGAEISVEGQALQEGRQGEIIRVKNMATNKTVVAKIVDASTVEVLNR